MKSLYPDYFLKTDVEPMFRRFEHGDSCFLIGIPGLGKSLFLYLLQQRLQENEQQNFQAAIVDFNEIDVVERETAFQFVLREINEDTGHSFSHLDALVDHALNLPDNHRLIVLVDRFEKTFQHLEQDFFDKLRWIIANTKQKVMFVFSVDVHPRELMESQLVNQLYARISPFTYYLKPFPEKESIFILQNEAENRGFGLSEKEYREIYRRSGGHNRLMKAYLHTLFVNQKEQISEDVLQEADMSEAVVYQCQRIIERLSKKDRQVIARLVSGQEVSSGLLTEMNVLKRLGVITEENTVFSQRFGEYVVESLGPMTKSTLQLNEQGEIVYSNQRIDDQLSRQEYLLLKLLLEEPGKIVSRDEVIERVWGEDEAIGVSDEAIDQVVLRVRQKLEEFGLPRETIKTLRGRGFQLILS